MRFEKISLDEGLSDSIITSINQDSKGLLWITTQDGLNCYDGYRFKVFKNDGRSKISIPYNALHRTFEDSSKNLWIGGDNYSLTVLNQETNSIMNIRLIKNKYNFNVSGIVEDSQENIWVSTFGNGLFKIKNFKVESHIFRNPENNDSINCNEIYYMLYDKESDKIYIGTWTGGMNILDLNSMKCIHHKFIPDNPDTISDNRIKCILKDSRGDLWLSTHQKGLNKYCGQDSKFLKYCHDINNENSISENVLTEICEDREGMLWIASKNQGLNRYDPSDDSFTRFKFNKSDPYSLSCNSISSLFVDRSNVLWVGTWGEGLCKADLSQKKFYSISNNLVDKSNVKFDKITSVCVDSKKSIWMGTYGIGIYKSTSERFSDFEKFSPIEKKSVYNVLEDKQSNMWFLSELHGLCSYNLHSEKFEIYENEKINLKEVRSFPLLLDSLNENLLWIGTEEHGLIRFDIKRREFLESNFNLLKSFTVYALYRDSEGLLWIGTNCNGLFLLDSGSEIINDNFSALLLDKFSDIKIWCINEDITGTIWIGTSSGLFRINKKEQEIKQYKEKHGLTNDTVYAIFTDKSNYLWLSTNSGLSKFDSEREIFLNFNHHDGLSGNEFNSFSYFKDNKDIMYFGGMNGVTYFNPDEIKINSYIPDIVITDFEIFNKPVTGGFENQFLKKDILHADEINLTYRESVFSFRFAALIFNNPQKNQYAYKMEGFDKDWTECGTRKRVTYTNLNPGNYKFRVRGSNNDGVWNEEGTSIKINISPPYWKTVWFKGLSLFSLVGVLGLAYRQRLEKLEKETRAQEEFSRRLIEAQENEKKRIAHELHDTIAHEVLISKNKALMALKHKSDKDRMEKALEEISEMSSATITEVRNIAYNMHPHQLERLGFTKTIKSIINDVSKSTNINFVFDADNVDELLSKESEINLFRVVQETISNIIKHSKATEVILKVTKTENNLEILIVDNGKGFDLRSKEFDEARQGFGLSGIEERIKFMNGEIRIDSEINKGTTLKFKIPIVKING